APHRADRHARTRSERRAQSSAARLAGSRAGLTRYGRAVTRGFMGIQRALANVRNNVQEIPAFRQLVEQASEENAAAEQAEQSAAAQKAMWLGALVETAYIIGAADGS